MHAALKRHGVWMIAWGLLSLLGAVLLARNALQQEREAFETNARIAHRLLSQQVVQHDAVLATLALLDANDDSAHPEQRLPSVYPHMLSVQRRARAVLWPDAHLQTLDAQSRQLGRGLLVQTDFAQGRYELMLGALPASYLLKIDIRSMVPWREWPMAPNQGPVRVALVYGGQAFDLQPGRQVPADAPGWHFDFHKVLASPSQPFEMVAQRHVAWGELPWLWMLAWSVLAAALLRMMWVLVRQRDDRHRAEELLRLGQVARLNTLGELAAGMAHELNQPLTAVLANTQAASRLLDDDAPDMQAVRHAMTQAVGQSRRAAEVVGRLRRLVEQPASTQPLQAVSLGDAARKSLYLMEPELKRQQVVVTLKASDVPCWVLADAVALDQIVHNLLMNAAQAMQTTSKAERRLTVAVEPTHSQARLLVQDQGPGIPAEALSRIFEPFFTTREGGLGLGLSLCETLAMGMGGTLSAKNRTPHGAEFCLTLPLAEPTAAAL
jgi:signal transduction histidine kinase